MIMITTITTSMITMVIIIPTKMVATTSLLLYCYCHYYHYQHYFCCCYCYRYIIIIIIIIISISFWSLSHLLSSLLLSFSYHHLIIVIIRNWKPFFQPVNHPPPTPPTPTPSCLSDFKGVGGISRHNLTASRNPRIWRLATYRIELISQKNIAVQPWTSAGSRHGQVRMKLYYTG